MSAGGEKKVGTDVITIRGKGRQLTSQVKMTPDQKHLGQNENTNKIIESLVSSDFLTV